MQGFLNAWVAGPCSVLPPSFPLEKLRNLLGSLPGAGNLLLVPLWEGRLPLGLLVLPAGSEEDLDVQWFECAMIWMCRGLVQCWAIEGKPWQWDWRKPWFSNEGRPRLGYFNQAKPQTLEEIHIWLRFQMFKLAVFLIFEEPSLLCQSLWLFGVHLPPSWKQLQLMNWQQSSPFTLALDKWGANVSAVMSGCQSRYSTYLLACTDFPVDTEPWCLSTSKISGLYPKRSVCSHLKLC